MARSLINVFGANATLVGAGTIDARLHVYWKDLRAEGWDLNTDLTNGEKWLAAMCLRNTYSQARWDALPQVDKNALRFYIRNSFPQLTTINNQNYRAYNHNLTVLTQDLNALEPDIDLIV